jgi:predicted Fe-Mo cluster-binding NifX family protein
MVNAEPDVLRFPCAIPLPRPCEGDPEMKIAAITDDGETISQHFGRARYYKMCMVEDGNITGREMRDKMAHHDFAHEDDHHEGRDDARGHGFGARAATRHASMISAIADCDVVLVRGMGRGAYITMEEAGITPVVTDIETIEEAVQAYVDGKLVDHTELLH